MTDAIIPPPVPPGWQRRQELIARLADIQAEIDEVRRVLPSVNDVTLRPRVEDLLAVAAELVAVHGTEPGGDIAEALAGLQSATRALRVPASDPDLGVTETLRTLRAAQGRLRSAVDDALDAVRAAHLAPVGMPEQRESSAMLPLQAMLKRLDAVAQRLDALEAAKDEQTPFVQQAGLVNFYVGAMRVEVDLARLHLTIGEDSFDLGALSRAAESMAELTADFVATVRDWTRRLSNVLSATVVRLAEETRQTVRGVTGGVAKLVRIVLGRAERRQRAAAATEPSQGVAEPEMVLIPPGRFVMGVPPEESAREKSDDDDARPQHEVTIRHGFWLAKYPVTRAEFAVFVADTGYVQSGGAYGWVEAKRTWEPSDQFGWQNPGFAQTDRDPVVCVSADEADAYAKWLADKTGRRYRLPSEAEWEYAARAGTTTARFWGDDRNGARHYANVADRSLAKRLKQKPDPERFFPWDDGHPFTSPVGSFQPNGFGLYDMLGNVWEWVADHWHDDYGEAPNDGSAWTTPGSEGRRVLRGGSWVGDPGGLRAGARNGIGTGSRDNYSGFRLARTR